MLLSHGSRLGPYEVDAMLGAGGMGQVWRARDVRIGRDVAIKVLPSEFAANAQLRIRFEQEARAICRLAHPNICHLYDVGECDGINYLVMELLQGETLADRIARGPLPLVDVVRIGSEIAEGLETAHRQRIVHRDLKPANVMLTRSGAKLLDFGLAKAIDDDGTLRMQRPLTSAGFVVGTPQYMSPEQMAAGTVDCRSDIFALGAVLYEMLTGRPAFDGDSHRALAKAILTETPPPLESAALNHIVMKCLEKEPDARWQNAHDVAEELRWIGSGGVVAAPPAAKPRRAWWVAAVAAIAIVAAGIATYASLHRPRTAYRFTLPSESARYTDAWLAFVSPDGKSVAFAAFDRATHSRMLWLRRLDSFDAEPIAGTAGAARFGQLTWTPDGRSLVYVNGDKLLRIAVSGGPPQVLVPSGVFAFGATVNADGVTLFARGRGGICRIGANGAIEEITKLGDAVLMHTFPVFLPDGKHFLYLVIDRNPKDAVHYPRLYAGSLDSKETRFVGIVGSQVRYVPGYLVTVRDGTLVALPFDARQLKITGAPLPMLDSVVDLLTAGNGCFSISDNGVLTALTPDRSQRLVPMSADGTAGAPVAEHGTFSRLHLSRDGNVVLFDRDDERYGTDDVWAHDLRDGSEQRLTSDSTLEFSPVFSPDRRRIYFASDRSSWPDIYEKNLESGEERVVVAAPGMQRPCDVSADGKWLLYHTDEDPKIGVALCAKRVDTADPPVKVVAIPGNTAFGDARFSPDGAWVAYIGRESGIAQIYVKRFPPAGAARMVSSDATSEESAPRWSADGKWLYFARGTGLWRVPFDSATGSSGAAQKLLDVRGGITDYEPMHDGRFLVKLADDAASAPVTRVVVGTESLLP